MARKTSKIIFDPPRYVRQRQRSDGTWRLWWEPPGDLRAMGVQDEELDPNRVQWSIRRAQDLNRSADKARAAGSVVADGASGVTIERVISQYRASRYYLKLADATKRDYTSKLNIIAEKWGPFPAASFDKPTMNAWYETNLDARGTTQARQLNAMMSRLFYFCEVKGWRTQNSNPCARMSAIQPRARARVASWAEFDALVGSADALGLPSVGTACGLSFFHGQRQNNILIAKREEFWREDLADPATGQPTSSWIWGFVRTKRGNPGAMIVHPDFVARLETTLAHLPDDAERLLIEERIGRGYDLDLFGRRFQEVRTHAARLCPSVRSLTFRDLRRTFSIMARAGGASLEDAEDALGNTAAQDVQLRNTYMYPQFATASRAVLAVQRPTDQKKNRA